jgi:S-adenosylmethionine hydrolase
MRYDWVSFTSDYGRADGFVAACHGVILGEAPHVRVIDVTHDVPPGDIRRGATVLAQTVESLPPAVHLAVIDPGVGTQRRGLAVDTGSGILVGPDNGLLVPAAEMLGGIVAAYELTERELWAYPPSPTFHGRDVFAPVVAHLANGVEVSRVGRELARRDLVRLPEPLVTARPGELTAEVQTIDRFGNVQLAATDADIESAALRPGQHVAVTVDPTAQAADLPALQPTAGTPAGQPAPGATVGQPAGGVPDLQPSAGTPASQTAPGAAVGQSAAGAEPGAASRTFRGTVGRTFADVAPGELVVFVDSAWHVAIAVNAGSAAETLSVTPGQLVSVINHSEGSGRPASG